MPVKGGLELAELFCENCGQRFPEDGPQMKFCDRCGSPLSTVPIISLEEDLTKLRSRYGEVERLRLDVERLRQEADMQRLRQEKVRLEREKVSLAETLEGITRLGGPFNEIERLRQDVEKLRHEAEVQRLRQERVRLEREKASLTETIEGFTKLGGPFNEVERLRQDVERLRHEAEVHRLRQEKLRLEREKASLSETLEGLTRVGEPYSEAERVKEEPKAEPLVRERPPLEREKAVLAETVGEPSKVEVPLTEIERIQHETRTRPLVQERIPSEEEQRPSTRTRAAQRFAGLNRRVGIGILLASIGGITGILSYMMRMTPMVALGAGFLLIGIIVLYLPESGSLASTVASDSVVSSLLNMENLLEDLDLNEKGIYVPVSGLGVSPKVFVPLSPDTKRPPAGLTESSRMFVTVGESPQDRGILLDAPGSGLLASLERHQRLDLAKVQLKDLQTSLNSGARVLGITKVTSLVHQGLGVRIEMELNDTLEFETKLRNLIPRLSTQIGTPIPSAVAAGVSKTTGKYVRMNSSILDIPNRKVSLILTLSP